jgi:peptide/nickel transport system substrate-binding protein
MIQRSFRSLLTLGLTTLLAVALAQTPQFGGTLNVAVSEPIPSLDMQRAITPGVVNVLINVYEPLVTKDFGGAVLPALAHSWDVSADQLTYTFYLREGVKFHDGSDLTADDVVASLERMRSVTGTSWETRDIERVERVDDHTVQVHLSVPFTGLLDRLGTAPSGWGIMPEEIARRLFDGEITGDDVVGTGPYRLADFEAQQWWELERFEDYHGQITGPSDHKAGERPAYLDRIRVTRVAEAGTRLAGLLAGDYDFVDDLSADDLPLLERNPDLGFQLMPGALGWYVKFNAVEGPMANETLRRAVRSAIDPEEIMAGFGDPRTWELNLYPRFHPSSPYYLDDNTARYYPNDLELGRQLVEQSGYAGEPIRFYASRDLAGWYVQAIGMMPTLEALGLNVELIVVDRAAQLSLTRDPADWEMKTSYSTPIRRAGVLGFHGIHRRGDRWNWSDAEHQYWENVLFRDLDRRDDAIMRLVEIELERAGQIWLGHTASLRGFQQGIHGVPNSHYLTFWTMWRE